MSVRHGVWVPPFDELADPRVLARLAAEAEEVGWDGCFLWDHVRWHAPVRATTDAWTALAAIAVATETVTIGPLVTPLPRRRPQTIARATAAIDLLADGRLVLGVGIGDDRFGGELSRFGERLDARARGAMLDESLAILRAAWSGEPVRHRGEHHVVDDVTFLPRPPRGDVPVWCAAMPGSARPLRRAARHDGCVLVNLAHPGEVASALAIVGTERADAGAPFDVAVAMAAGEDPAAWEGAGATWLLTDLAAEDGRLDAVRALVRAGPPR